MFKSKYSLSPNEPKRLELSWGFFGKLSIWLDGKLIAKISNQEDLKKGQMFRLPDESCLSIQVTQRLWVKELHLLHDGIPIPGASHPLQRLKRAYWCIFLLASLHITAGLVICLAVTLFGAEQPAAVAILFGILAILAGLGFFIMGFLVKRKSRVALIIAVTLYAFEAILYVFLAILGAINKGNTLPGSSNWILTFFSWLGLIVGLTFFAEALIRGIGAIEATTEQSLAATKSIKPSV